ncbi:hypothetical protein [Cyanobacterium sp. Dongsha4]|uniref:hypothetical protein n=1 Tax=Cyanobacterium sp. DS4 TaxID=2878255 RepID=UPI002E809DA0|nr:hypothetical protein [Cyanobacterium sp. Dongsha4]WVL00599.1 hypothetical protein Dongsha4_18465 [Cyanobacterium sp. Dongsha4]
MVKYFNTAGGKYIAEVSNFSGSVSNYTLSVARLDPFVMGDRMQFATITPTNSVEDSETVGAPRYAVSFSNVTWEIKKTSAGNIDVSLTSDYSEAQMRARIYQDTNNNGILDNQDSIITERNNTRNAFITITDADISPDQSFFVMASHQEPSFSGFDVLLSASYSNDTPINPDPTNPTNPTNPQFDTPLNRFQNSSVPGTYLFAGEEESQSIRQNFSNFAEEGFAFSVSSQPHQELIVFNRFQNRNLPGTYLYAGEEESRSIRQNFPNFVEEGVAFYAFSGDANRGTDFYRFQNTQQPGTYLFVGEEEKNSILANFPQFVLEGIAFEVLS